MARLSLLISFLFASRTLAAYVDYFFATEASEWLCPNMGFQCIPPAACVRDDVVDKHYCCNPGADSICWIGSPDCGDNRTPLSGQIGCSSGENAFCCLENREQCTQTRNQINICWATAPNPLLAITGEKMNETFSSLSSAAPSATAQSFDLEALLATSSTIPASSSVPSTSGGPTSSPTPSSQTSPPVSSSTATPSNASSSSGLSGGAIGGIAVGAIAGVAIIGAAAFLFWRRGNKKIQGNELDTNQYHGAYGPQGDVLHKYTHSGNGYDGVQYAQVHEMDPNMARVEMEGSKPEEMEGSKPESMEGSKPESRERMG